MCAWWVKTRHAPSRHFRDARVNGHTTTAMHEIEYISSIEYTPPPAPYLVLAIPKLEFEARHPHCLVTETI